MDFLKKKKTPQTFGAPSLDYRALKLQSDYMVYALRISVRCMAGGLKIPRFMRLLNGRFFVTLCEARRICYTLR
jgi:hypothetical protein